MKRTAQSTLLAALLGIGAMAAHAETVGIGDDTLEFIMPQASVAVPDVTRAFGLDGPEALETEANAVRAGDATDAGTGQDWPFYARVGHL